jgi:hypothetical protein
LNDGLAFPFVNLALAVAASGGIVGLWTLEWFALDVLWNDEQLGFSRQQMRPVYVPTTSSSRDRRRLASVELLMNSAERFSAWVAWVS